MARVLVPRCLPRPASLARPPPAHFSRHLLTARRLCTEAEPEERPPTLIVKREGGGLATLSLKHKPVNSLTQAVCEELKAVTHELEADPEVRGVVFGSGVPGVFSAGLDLRSMHNRSTDELAAFWKAVQEMWLALYTTRLATVAAIPGHCIAGGCILALACDVRVMVDGGKGRFGVNETTFGLVPPPWLTQMMVDAAGLKAAAPLVQRGLLLPAEDALAAGLVDQTASLSRLAEESSARLNELLAVPDHARAQVKHQLRHTLADTLQYDGGRSDDLDLFMDLATSTDVQVQLKSYLKSLKKK